MTTEETEPAPTPDGDPGDPGARQRQLAGLLAADVGLHYVAWCSHGRCESERDALPAAPGIADETVTGVTDETVTGVADETVTGVADETVTGSGGRRGPAELRAACRQLAEKLSFHTDQHLDDRLSVLATGRLVRTVLAADRGAAYCDQIVPGSYLVGVTVGLPADPAARQEVTYRADETLAQQVETFRDGIHARQLDLGGWRSERLRERLRAAQPRLVPPPSFEDTGEFLAPGPPAVVTGAADHPAVAFCQLVVRPRDLHLVSLYQDGKLVFSVDVWHDARLDRGRGGELGATVRRARYERLGVDVPDYLRELGRSARKVIGGPLQRAVLDVESGAVYYRRLDSSRYLIAATAFQPQVRAAESLVDQLTASWPT